MPPKPKFTREEIVSAALDLVAQKGPEGLTARDLGAAMGSSARPIFTVFSGMEEVLADVRKAAMTLFESYADQTPPNTPPFKQFGLQLVRFAQREPKLYQLLFLQENQSPAGYDDAFGPFAPTVKVCIDAIRRDHGLSLADAKALFENIWIYTFGLGALCATGVCRVTEGQLGQMLSSQFQAMTLLQRSGRLRGR